MNILVVINTLILTILSLIHFYWALGGKRAWDSALPTKKSGEYLFIPSQIQTVAVGLGLMIFAVVTASNSGFLDAILARKYVHQATGVIAGIFLIRAIGDFNYVGFTKKVKGTRFAVYDTRLYSPLSLIIAILNGLIALR